MYHASQPITSNLRMGFSAGTRHLANSAAEDGSVLDDESSNQSFFFILTVLVASISALCFLLCILQLIQHHLTHYCCKRDDGVPETPDTVLVHKGRIFNLAGNQRRAVLEVIFSETSKVSFFFLFSYRLIFALVGYAYNRKRNSMLKCISELLLLRYSESGDC